MNLKLIFILFFAIFHECEFSCLNSYHECGSNDPFKCIPKSWVCDNNYDCQDGSDEFNCPIVPCRNDQFKCVNSLECISDDLICDGKNDCFDNSDEDNCTRIKGMCNEKTEYDCKNDEKLECIPIEGVCNKKFNCSTNREKNENCEINMCLKNNTNQCSHICINKFSSFSCDCPPGMFLAPDKVTCKHFNKCLERPNVCSQECTDMGVGYQCSCYKGYILKENKCIPRYPEDAIYLLYSSFSNIYGTPIFDANIDNLTFASDLLKSDSNIRFFDSKLNKNDLILYSSLEENDKKLSVETFKSWPSSFDISINQKYMPKIFVEKMSYKINLEYLKISSSALDSARNLLFFTDINNHSISVMNLTSLDQMKIVEKDLYLPVSVVIDPVYAKLFWIDLGKENVAPKIEMANMDGSSRLVILQNNLHKPISLSVDIDEQKLYWANHSPPSIHFIDLNLLRKNIFRSTIVLENVLLQPFSIAILENRIYWSDWHQNRIYSAHKISGKGVKMLKECKNPKIIKMVSKQFNDELIERVYKERTSPFCSGLINHCPYSCLPKFNSSEFPLCFGSAPVSETRHNYKWWFILIPIVLIFGCIGYAKFRKSKINSLSVNESNGNIYDNVQFWDDDHRSIQEEIISTSPILKEEDA